MIISYYMYFFILFMMMVTSSVFFRMNMISVYVNLEFFSILFVFFFFFVFEYGMFFFSFYLFVFLVSEICLGISLLILYIRMVESDMCFILNMLD